MKKAKKDIEFEVKDILSEIMKKLFVIALAFLATTTAVVAQKKDSVAVVTKPIVRDATPVPAPAKKDWSKIKLTRRANDHFMFQLGYDNWAGATDTMRIQGFNRSVNFYVMFDFPFKTDPRFSVGAGLGIGTSNIFFDKQEVLVAANGNNSLAFPDESNGNHFKKYKLVTTFLESPVELRYAVDPENTNKSWKFAMGVKVGILLSAYTKGKTLQNIVDQTIFRYTEKESSTQFFNAPRLVGTARVSKGVIGVFGQFQLTSLLKTSTNPAIYPFSAGITLSGL
jgi:hypothetical protein